MSRAMVLVTAVACLHSGQSAARSEDKAAVNRAVERGTSYLRKLQKEDGTWPHDQIGATALAGLTLIECGAPDDDPAVTKALDAVRRACPTMTHTYSLACSILFLDRVGFKEDAVHIETLSVRLMAGQNPNGGWAYNCPAVAPEEAHKLIALLKQRHEMVARPLPTKKEKDEPSEQERRLTDRIRGQLETIAKDLPKKAADANDDDNSNTQFAILGLWVARRHGLPADGPLAIVNARFRASQSTDGGWDYKFHVGSGGKRPSEKSTATMTCAGLLGLAAVYGAVGEATMRTGRPGKDDGSAPKLPDPAQDRVITHGLLALSTVIGASVEQRGPGAEVPIFKDSNRTFYFLWSLERVAVAYGLSTIGGKDWYTWGAEVLVANQKEDGSWQGEFSSGGPDTCFSLLFLKRANLARDLSAVLKGKVSDPVALRSGGVGGGDLQKGLNIKRAGGDSKARAISAEAARMSKELVGAAAAKQDELIARLRDGKGTDFTDALADAITQLDTAPRKKARQALAERLSGMKATTLRDKLSDDDAEIRRAAALACAIKEDKSFTPRLIDLLEDNETTVARAAYAALKSLTGKDFGPSADADRAEQRRAVAAWRAWWSEKR
jgi:hypothetical protein